MTGEQKPWYEAFFDRSYLEVYEEALGEDKTSAEVAFLRQALGLRAGASILDLCCGTGRHALELARGGFEVVAQDLSADYLKAAEEDAAEAGVRLTTLRSDMREIPYERHFDAVINMFSAFGYLESESEDARVLQAVATALKPQGRVVLDLINREWVILNYVQMDWHEGSDGTVYLEHREFEPETSRNHVTFTAIAPNGRRHQIDGHHIRLYTLREMIAMIDEAGLEYEVAYGGHDGRPYSLDSGRMIVLAKRPL